MDRRDFLRSAGRTALGLAGMAALGAACTTSKNPGVLPSSVDAAAATGRPPTEAEWSTFGRDFAGRLIRPSDPGYATAKQLFDPRFDSLHPAAIAKCSSVADVQQSIQFARNHGMAFAARSGGHSYGGYSSGSGLVCDVGGLHGVTVDAGAKTAAVGAGAHLV